ncbi:MAG: hypothetical protein M1840_001164, partial [Geoglossum simile]
MQDSDSAYAGAASMSKVSSGLDRHRLIDLSLMRFFEGCSPLDGGKKRGDEWGDQKPRIPY